MKHKWESEIEEGVAKHALVTSSIVPDKESFEAFLRGSCISLKDENHPRYLVWPYPCGVAYDPSDEDGASGPFEAIQWSLDLHLDGGWDWLVWDRLQKTGFHIDSNSYLYAPLDAWAQKYYGIASFKERSSEALREIVDAATDELRRREQAGTL